MTGIQDELEEVGLAKYAVFAEHEITPDVLAEVNAPDTHCLALPRRERASAPAIAPDGFKAARPLTLLPRPQLPPDPSDAKYFDVTRNSTADSAGIGGINRVCWYAEVASQNARLGRVSAG